MGFFSCESLKKKKDKDLEAELEKRKMEMSSCLQCFWTEASSVWSFNGFNTFLYTTRTSWETPAIHTDMETSAGSKHGSAWIKIFIAGADQATSLTPCVSSVFLLATCS